MKYLTDDYMKLIKERKYSFENIMNDLMKDIDLIYICLKANSDSFVKLNTDFKENKELVLYALSLDLKLYNYAGAKIKKDIDVIMEAIKLTSNFEKIPKNLRTDKNFLEKAIQINPEIIKYVDSSFLNDKLVDLIIKKNPSIYMYLPIKYQQNLDYINLAVEFDGINFSYIPSDKKKDFNLALIAVKSNSNIYKNLSSDFKNNKEIILETVNNNANKYLEIPEKYKNDIDVCMKVLKKDPKKFDKFPEEIKNNEKIIEEALKHYPFLINNMNTNLINEKLIYIAVKSNAYVLKSKIVLSLFASFNYNFIYSLININDTCKKIIFEILSEDDYFWLYLIRKDINFKNTLPEAFKKDEMFMKLI